MTEAGEKWAKEKALSDPEYGTVHDFDTIVDFWLRAFCEAVEKRAKETTKVIGWLNLAESYYEIKRELLG